MLKTALCLTLLLLLGAGSPSFAKKPKKESPAKTEKPPKSPYQKFVSAKKTLKAEGFAKLYRQKGKFWMEIPDSLMGRRILISTVSLGGGSSLFYLPGQELSSQAVYVLDRTDSLLLLRVPSVPAQTSDTSMLAALDLAAAVPPKYAFPIKYRNADSTAIVADVSKLFDPSNKDILSFSSASVQISHHYDVSAATVKPELTRFEKLVSWPGSLGVVQEVSLSVAPKSHSEGGIVISYGEEFEHYTGEFQTTVNLLPKTSLPIRKVNPAVGVRSVDYKLYSSTKGVTSEKSASRWDLSDGKKITVYVDTLFAPSWRDAIRKGFEAWNRAFEEAGLGRVIDVRQYPSYGDFSPADPSASCVMAATSSDNLKPRLSILEDKSEGRIISFKMIIPLGYHRTAFEEGMFTIADVDSRFRDYYNFSDETVCEVLRARTMAFAGRALGLLPNYAASGAYSPAQLRSPSFTKVNGFTASVTDAPLFNFLARPGDKEKGVVLIHRQIGAYDKFAIDWLYRQFPEGTPVQEELDRMVKAKEGNPAYLYRPNYAGTPDPRIVTSDLGNDPLESYNEVINSVLYVADNASKWFKYADDELDLPKLILERCLVRILGQNVALANLLGGIRHIDVSKGKYEAVPKALQKQVIGILADSPDIFDWEQKTKAYSPFGDAGHDFQGFVLANYEYSTRFLTRLPMVAMAATVADSGYSVDEYLDDVTGAVLKGISQGKVRTAEEMGVLGYINALSQYAPVTASNRKEHFHSASLREDLVMPYSGIPVSALEGIETSVYIQLEKIVKVLQKARAAASDPEAKAKISFLLARAEACIENN